jgi:MYXO-CTERM domain-containing protein
MSVERADLEAKLREIQQAVEETSEGVKSPGVMLAVGAAALLVVTYLAGRRRGRKRSARVEVYRVR